MLPAGLDGLLGVEVGATLEVSAWATDGVRPIAVTLARDMSPAAMRPIFFERLTVSVGVASAALSRAKGTASAPVRRALTEDR